MFKLRPHRGDQEASGPVGQSEEASSQGKDPVEEGGHGQVHPGKPASKHVNCVY